MGAHGAPGHIGAPGQTVSTVELLLSFDRAVW